MEKTALLQSSNNAVDAVPQYVSTQTMKSYHLISNTILALVLLAVSLRILHKETYAKALWDTVSAVSFFAIVFGLSEIVIRLYHCLLDLVQLYSKYGGDAEQIFRSVNLNAPSWICLVLSFAAFTMLHIWAGNTVDHIWSLGLVACIPAFMISVVLCQITGLRDSALNTALAISSMGGVDYGTGMAYSYYYGYLAFVLPSDGVSNKGLRQKMEEWEDNENVSIPVKKLFILIPASGHIPPNLKEASDNWLESTKTLESVVMDRAGVKRRTYHNTVYKIHPGGDGKNHPPVYVTTEGATPMLTFYEVLKHDHPQTAAYREHRQQIVASFYETLKMLLNNDPGCRDVCELVFYNDKDANGKKVNVGEILLRKIHAQAPTLRYFYTVGAEAPTV